VETLQPEELPAPSLPPSPSLPAVVLDRPISPSKGGGLKSTFSIPKSLSQTQKLVEEQALPVVEEPSSVEDEPQAISNNAPLPELTQSLLDQAMPLVMEVYREANKGLELALLTQALQVINGEVHLAVTGAVQEDIATTMKPDLIALLQKHTGLRSVPVLVVQQEELPEQSGKLYTSTEKLRYLLEKYPVIRELQQKFDLDVDF